MATITETFRSNSPYGTFRMHLPEDPIAWQQRAQRQKVSGRFPPTVGIHEPLSFQKSYHNFRAREEIGETRPDGPRRQDTPVVDTINGFTSVGAEIEDGKYRFIEPLIQKNTGPQASNPYERHINSPTQKVIRETSHEELDCININNTGESNKSTSNTEKINSKEWRDAVALKAFYTSETQRMYRGVDWANSLPPPVIPPTSTMEPSPDVVTRNVLEKRYDSRPKVWQQLGSSPKSWDYVQSRNGYYRMGTVNFCSPSKKTGQIPGYSGFTPGHGERDNPSEPFTKIAYVRTHKPRYTDTSRRINIPGYTGITLFPGAEPNNNTRIQSTTTGRTHRKLQVPTTLNLSPFKRESHMSKMITLVHPYNPFNKVA